MSGLRAQAMQAWREQVDREWRENQARAVRERAENFEWFAKSVCDKLGLCVVQPSGYLKDYESDRETIPYYEADGIRLVHSGSCPSLQLWCACGGGWVLYGAVTAVEDIGRCIDAQEKAPRACGDCWRTGRHQPASHAPTIEERLVSVIRDIVWNVLPESAR